MKFQIFILDFAAIVLEAMPFLVIGSLLGSIIEEYLPEKFFRSSIFRRKRTGFPVSILLGIFLPTCECGVIPIARKLARKGLPANMAVVYMFSAPVINPIVILATFIAFRFNIWMVAGRIAVSAITAFITGIFLSGKGELFLGGMQSDNSDSLLDFHDHLHDHEHEYIHKKKFSLGKAAAITGHAGSDLLDMTRFLVLGALISSAFHILIPRDIIRYFQPNLPLSILFMMTLAVLLSICSEADAFVASSFVKFSPFAQLAFVTIGPVFDLKLLLMYNGTFRKKIIKYVTALPFVIVFILMIVSGLIWQFFIKNGGRL